MADQTTSVASSPAHGHIQFPLPPEIRLMIYELLLPPPGTRVHLHGAKISSNFKPTFSQLAFLVFNRTKIDPGKRFRLCDVKDPGCLTPLSSDLFEEKDLCAWSFEDPRYSFRGLHNSLWLCGMTRREAASRVFDNVTFHFECPWSARNFLKELSPKNNTIRLLEIGAIPINTAKHSSSDNLVGAIKMARNIDWLKSLEICLTGPWYLSCKAYFVWDWIEELKKLDGVEKKVDFDCLQYGPKFDGNLTNAALAWSGRKKIPGWNDSKLGGEDQYRYMKEKINEWLAI